MKSTNEAAALKNELITLKRKYKEKKEVIYNLTLENKAYAKENKLLTQEVADQKVYYEAEIKRLKSEHEERVGDLQGRCDSMLKKQQQTAVALSNAKQNIRAFNESNGSKKTLKKIRELTLENVKLEQQTKNLMRNIKQFDNTKLSSRSINRQIIELRQQLSYSTLMYYGTNLDNLMASVNKMRASKQAVASCTTQIGTVEELYLFGYMITHDNSIMFCTVSQEWYPVSGIEGDMERLSVMLNYPCKALLNADNTVTVSSIYTETNPVTPEKREKLHKHFTPKNTFTYDKPLAVLMIGSEQQTNYTRLVKSLGLTPIWFNPYERNIKRLENLVPQADIVIGFKSSMPLSALDFLDLDSPTTHLLTRQSRPLFLSTLNVIIMERDLAQIRNQSTDLLVDGTYNEEI